MKIRTGFVSNSSSSSFALWGMSFSLEDGEEENGLPDTPENLFEGKISYVWAFEEGYAVAGLSPNEQAENQTLAEFKEQIRAKLEKILKRPIIKEEVEFHSGEYSC